MNKIKSHVVCFLALICSFFLMFQQEQEKAKPEQEVRSYAESILRFELLNATCNSGSPYFFLSEELEIIEEQRRQLQPHLMSFLTRSRAAMMKQNNAVLNARKNNDNKAAAKAQGEYEETMINLVAATEKNVSNILMPHQMKRAEQISYQMGMSRKHGVNGSFVLVPIVKELDIPSREKKKFEKEVEKLRADYVKEVSDIRKKYEKAVMGAIPESARELLDKKIGELIDEQ